jgi:hypothetical protein
MPIAGSRSKSLTPDNAATLSLQVLSFLAERPDDIGRFLDISGLDPATVRARAAEPAFLASILDFLLSNEALLIDFCEAESVDAKDIHMARHILGGP